MSQAHPPDDDPDSADSIDFTNRTTIPVAVEIRDRLFDEKEPTDSYNDVLLRLLDD
jgi:hypothetical protein